MKRRRRKRRTASRGAKTPLQSAICCLETTCRTPSPPPPLPPRLPPLPRLKLPRPPSCARHSAHPPSPCPVAARLRCRRRPPLFTLHHPPMPPAAVKASSILARLRHCTEVKASSILARCSPRHASKPPPPPPPTPPPPTPPPPTSTPTPPPMALAQAAAVQGLVNARPTYRPQIAAPARRRRSVAEASSDGHTASSSYERFAARHSATIHTVARRRVVAAAPTRRRPRLRGPSPPQPPEFTTWRPPPPLPSPPPPPPLPRCPGSPPAGRSPLACLRRKVPMILIADAIAELLAGLRRKVPMWK